MNTSLKVISTLFILFGIIGVLYAMQSTKRSPEPPVLWHQGETDRSPKMSEEFRQACLDQFREKWVLKGGTCQAEAVLWCDQSITEVSDNRGNTWEKQ